MLKKIGTLFILLTSFALSQTSVTTIPGDLRVRGTATVAADPVSALQVATKQYVDALAAGFQFKDPVVAATTANITLSGAQTIDGVSVIATNRVLVKNQSTASQNGIYVAAAGAWSRSTDMDVAGEFPGAITYITGGTVNGGDQYIVSTPAPITVGSTNITWSLFTSSSDVTSGNPTATIGLSIVNGAASTYLRSDGAPALSQAIVPTWTGAHTFNAATTFGSTITTPLTATRLLTVNASSQLAVNAALTANGFLYATGAGGIASTAAAGNGQILIGSTGVAPVLGTLSGTANQISVSQGAGTLGLSIPNTLVVPDSLNVGALTGADTRMVVVGADGGLFTQAIPSSGLTGSGAANRVTFWSGASTLTSDAGFVFNPATPNLSVGASLNVSGASNFSDAIGFNGVVSIGAGHIYRTSADGLTLQGVDGSSNTFQLLNAAGTDIMQLSTGNVMSFPHASGIAITGPITATDLSGSGTRMVVADASGVVSTQTIPVAGSLANPSATIGLTAVNGVATSGMRSDGAPALSQAITPTWTGAHVFSNNVSLASVAAGQVAYSNGSGVLAGSGNFAWNGATLAVVGDGSYSGTLTVTSGMNLSWLNTARVPFIGASGAVTSSSNLTYTTGTNTFATANGTFSGTVGVAGDATLSGLLHVSNALPEIRMTDAGGGDIFSLQNDGGDFSIRNNTDAANIIRVLGSGNSVQLNGATAVSGLLTGSAHVLTSGTSPAYRFDQTSAGADERLWDIQAASGQLVFRTRTDANGTGATWLTVDRTGTTVDAVTLPILAGSGTRMVVADASGVISTQSIPAAGSLANPTATIGLTAVNGVATSGMRSDGAPALSQAIVPTWSGLHTFSTGLAITGGSPLTPGRITHTSSNGIIITGADNAAANDFLLLNGDLGTVAYVPNNNTELIVNKLEVEDSTRLNILAGSGTRMVVADATGILSTQSIPAAGSLANPTGTIGLTAVNGSATSGMRSDGAPALSQAIAPTWTGSHSFTAGFSAHSGSNAGQVRIGGGSSHNNAGDGGWIVLNGATVPTAAGYVELRSSTVTGAGDTGTVRIWPAAGGSTRFGRVDDEGTRWATHVQGDLRVDDSVAVLGRLGHGATVKYVDTVSPGASIEIPLQTSDLITITMTQDASFTVEDGAATGRHITLRIHQDGTGNHAITWGSEFVFPESGEPTQSNAASTWSYYSFMYNEIENTWDYVGASIGFGGS